MSTTKRIPWIAAAIFLALLTATLAAAQKSLSPEALFQRAVQKEKVDGDTKAAIDLYKQVAAAPGASQKLKAQAQTQVNALDRSSVPSSLTTRLISNSIGRNSSISADGRFMAFSINEFDLAIQDLTTGQITRPAGAQRTTPNPGPGPTAGFGDGLVFSPLVSPDGQQVAYRWEGNEGVQLRVISNAAGAQPRTVVENKNKEFAHINPSAWATDGRILATVDKPDETWELVWVSTMTGKVTPLKSLGWRTPYGGPRPTLSPDGKYVAYGALAGNPGKDGGAPNDPTHIYVLAADGSAPEIDLVTGANLNESPVWMPDGKSVLFVSNRDGNFGIWSVGVQNGKPGNLVQVKPEIGRISPVGMTKSGSYYYGTQITWANKILITQFSGSGVQTSKRKPETIFGDKPVWSPDGKSIALIRPNRMLGPGGRGAQSQVDPVTKTSIVIYSVDTRDEKAFTMKQELTPTSPGWPDPLWLHDGKGVVLFTQDSKGNNSLYRADLKTGEFRHVAPAPISDFSPQVVLSSDDKKIYMLEGISGSLGRGAPPSTGTKLGRLLAIDLNSGQQRIVSTVSTAATDVEMALSSDDKSIYMIMTERPRPPLGGASSSQLLAIDVSNGQQKTLLDGPQIGLHAYGTNTKALYTMSCDPKCDRIVAVDLITGQQRQVIKVQAPQVIAGLALSADERSLAFNVIDGEARQLARIGVDGAEYRKLDATLGGGAQASLQPLQWTRDGAWILGRSTSTPVLPSLLRVPVTGGNVEEIPLKPEGMGYSPGPVLQLSPDGSRMAVFINERIDESVWALDNVSTFLKSAK